MGILVFVQPKRAFQKWLKAQSAPAARPKSPLARRGEDDFLTGPCASCHTIRGTPARGFVGPDLTHLASRTTLAALTIPNRRSYLARWIGNAQHFKPGNLMPDFALGGSRVRAIVAYLESLK
jgi:cytochrome c oxidase subunit 2